MYVFVMFVIVLEISFAASDPLFIYRVLCPGELTSMGVFNRAPWFSGFWLSLAWEVTVKWLHVGQRESSEYFPEFL